MQTKTWNHDFLTFSTLYTCPITLYLHMSFFIPDLRPMLFSSVITQYNVYLLEYFPMSCLKKHNRHAQKQKVDSNSNKRRWYMHRNGNVDIVLYLNTFDHAAYLQQAICNLWPYTWPQTLDNTTKQRTGPQWLRWWANFGVKSTT